MLRRIFWTGTAAVWTVPVLVLSCSSAPEKAGDPCETDGDPCPAGMVCQPGADDETVCLIEAGGSCDDKAADPFCENGSSCILDAATNKATCGLGPGATCDPAKTECAPPNECVTDPATNTSTCGLPLGAPCDPAKTECAAPNVCEEEADGTPECGIPEGGACDPALEDPQCSGDRVCAELAAGGFACYPPVVVEGRVFDAQTDAGIEGAHVLGLDDQSTAITDIAISVADGAYSLTLPVPRDAEGVPTDVTFTLRASAQDYQTFPSGLRTSLPIQTGGATKGEKNYVVKLPLTDISLIPLAVGETGRPSIAGTVLADDKSAGVLVVAEEGPGAGLSAVSSTKGAYTIFNVPTGAYVVRGYAAGIALTPANADVQAAPLTGVDLLPSGEALGSIEGTVQIVNGGGGDATSVVLVVESTFSATFVRGEVPRGLRAPLSGPPTVTGAFSIADVPPGKYVVLAAFENDLLVRDPDPNIAGTQILFQEMPSPGVAITLSDSFKVTGALAVVSPGAGDPEGVPGTPTFQWVDDSSEDFYSIVVYDAYGNLVWEDPNIPSVSGGGNVSVTYAGPALETGMYYQFRATSWRSPGGNVGPISTTEDLLGVFFIQ